MFGSGEYRRTSGRLARLSMASGVPGGLHRGWHCTGPLLGRFRGGGGGVAAAGHAHYLADVCGYDADHATAVLATPHDVGVATALCHHGEEQHHVEV